MTNEQFTAALADKSAQLHVGLDNSTRVAFEAGAMWAKEFIEASPTKGNRPFRPGQLVKWVQPSGIKPGIVRVIEKDTSGLESGLIVEFPDGQQRFWADGRYSCFDSEPSLFHIEPRPFRPGDRVRWKRNGGDLTGVVRGASPSVNRPTSSIIVDFEYSEEEFWADGRYSSYDSEPSLFHID